MCKHGDDFEAECARRGEIIKRLVEDGERLAKILCEGAKPDDALCVCNFYEARDACYEHAHLIEGVEK